MFSKKLKLVLICTILSFIIGCGTLGNIGYAIYFPTSKIKLEKAMDTLFSLYPKYEMPIKWEQYNTWSKRSYNFLESRIFYFNQSPEEMYYVTFIGDSTVLADTSRVGIGIRAIFNSDSTKWYIGNEFKKEDKERIQARFFNEIVIKLEKFTQTKAHYESIW